MITKKQIYLMSCVAGISVANIYYNQPILNTIADDLHLSHLAIGYLPTFAQAGYGFGLFFVSPLGDKMDKKRLLLILHLLLGLTLIGLSFINNINILYMLSFLVGLFAVSPQVVIPMAAGMSGKDKGKVVGTLISGLLAGILLARTFSGYITAWSGNWHAIFAISSILVFVTMYMIHKMLPNAEPNFSNHYFSLLKSSIYQLKRFPQLRRNTLLIALVFGIFSSFWTTLTFKLNLAPFHFSNGTIGAFGLLGVGGVMLAPYTGKIADIINPFFVKLFSIFLTIFSIFLVRYFDTSLYAFIVAILFLDICFQAIQINNLTQIYALDESAHSRINTIYMSSMFLGGTLGTFIGVYCFESGGWDYVTIELMTLALLSLAIMIYDNIAQKTDTKTLNQECRVKS